MTNSNRAIGESDQPELWALVLITGVS